MSKKATFTPLRRLPKTLQRARLFRLPCGEWVRVCPEVRGKKAACHAASVVGLGQKAASSSPGA